MRILGIESSCDDMAAAVVEDGRRVLSSVISSQDAFHQAFRGVVPEIAARRHLETVIPVVEKALTDAGVAPGQLDGIAVTSRPGLIGSLLVGLTAARSLALAWGKPLVTVNHLAAHAWSLQLSGVFDWPHIILLVSGGHTLLLHARGPLDLEILGSTLDDACGEAFDKVAKHLGEGWPGGPAIDRLAKTGDPLAIPYPRVMLDDAAHRYDFSFSGLKTSVLYHTARLARKSDPTASDIAASFQQSAIHTLLEKTRRACRDLGVPRAGIVGGVSANSLLRDLTRGDGEIEWALPPLSVCTDNAAMVAGLGAEVFLRSGPATPDALRPLTRNPDARKVV
ncbi:MAG: tRNA (adenosine(37)-N6)-threonylcarbamoyltransferase complex transferase subunit TsaD [Spirochaetes bacterium]|nr:tRNA (adenosine(37)-N6)-threonylcarbamoyltransferase complex transferase subunit TsaD [Spirochaetota bacterium]